MLLLFKQIRDLFRPVDSKGNRYKKSGKKATYKDNIWDLWVRCDDDTNEYYVRANSRVDSDLVFIRAKYIIPAGTKIE